MIEGYNAQLIIFPSYLSSYHRITSLQRAAFKLFPDLRKFALSNVASVDTHSALLTHFSGLQSVYTSPFRGPIDTHIVYILLTDHEKEANFLYSVHACTIVICNH